jgi:hypothetical protein
LATHNAVRQETDALNYEGSIIVVDLLMSKNTYAYLWYLHPAGIISREKSTFVR